VKGNLRVYDLLRFRKIGKVCSSMKSVRDIGKALKSSISVTSAGSMIGETCF